VSVLDPKKLSYVICPTKFPSKDQEYFHNQNFNFWWSTWEETFRELGLSQSMTSDMYTRQEFTGSLFFEAECVAQVCYRTVDLSHAPSRFDSYFKNWTEKGMTALAVSGNRVLIPSYLSVSKKYRGTNLFGFALKDLIMGFCSFILKECQADSMATTPRRDRNVPLVCTGWGGELVEEAVPSGYGDFVDIVVFGKDYSEKAKLHPLYSLAQQLWSQRMIVPQIKNSNPLPLSA
jgi:hypothetical protein